MKQDISSVEHLIMDGGSTDGTLDVLMQYPQLRVVSQPDEGIYDALNKGIRLAHGEVIGFLNTDDLYEQDIFGEVAEAFTRHPEIDALVGGASILHEKSTGDWNSLATFSAIPAGELLRRATQGAPIFNAWFFRRRLFHDIGTFDTRYLYVADRDFLIRMVLQHRVYATLDKPVYQYRMHSGSITLSGQDSGEADYMHESRALAERYIRTKDIPSTELSLIKTWHSQITAEQIVTAWRKKAMRRIFQYSLIGLRFNLWGWPGTFSRKFVERLTVLLKGIFSYKSA